MKTISRLLITAMIMLIMSISAEKVMAQEDPPWLPDQHGNNGNQSPNGAPLDGGSEVLLFLGIAYAVKKVSDWKRTTKVDR